MKTSSGAWLTLAVLLVGAFLLTAAHRIQQYKTYPDVTGEEITARQRALVDADSSTSTSLFNLAFGALVGLVSLQVHGKRSQRPSGALPMVAAALLALSMYASFLFRTQLALSLGRGPLALLAGPGIDQTLTAQFWLFVVGILLLLFWVFPVRNIVCIALAAMAFTPAAVSAQEVTVPECAAAWAADRKVTLPANSRGAVESLVANVAGEAKVALDASSRCPFTESLLDELRRRVVANGADVENPSQELVKAIDEAVATIYQKPDTYLPGPPPPKSGNFSFGDAVSRLLTMAEVWNEPSGLLVVRSSEGALQVIATTVKGTPGDWKGLTNWTVRVPAGVYRIEVTKDGVRMNGPGRIEVSSGQRLEIDFPVSK
jgi:hypothetical protein